MELAKVKGIVRSIKIISRMSSRVINAEAMNPNEDQKIAPKINPEKNRNMFDHVNGTKLRDTKNANKPTTIAFRKVVHTLAMSLAAKQETNGVGETTITAVIRDARSPRTKAKVKAKRRKVK
jgi:hypothetical protein